MAYLTDFQYILVATICLIPLVYIIKRQKKHDFSQIEAAAN